MHEAMQQIPVPGANAVSDEIDTERVTDAESACNHRGTGANCRGILTPVPIIW